MRPESRTDTRSYATRASGRGARFKRARSESTSPDALARHLLLERGGDGGVEAGLPARSLLALGGDVLVALLRERDYLFAHLLALGEASLDLLPALLRL